MTPLPATYHGEPCAIVDIDQEGGTAVILRRRPADHSLGGLTVVALDDLDVFRMAYADGRDAESALAFAEAAALVSVPAMMPTRREKGPWTSSGLPSSRSSSAGAA